MTQGFQYSTSYVLDKNLFSETYDESVTALPAHKAYAKPAIIASVGTILVMFTEVSPYISWFVVTWGAIEALNVRFHKAWWLARQIVSRAANNELTLTMDENGIGIKSHYVNNTINWPDIKKYEKTNKGWLLHLDKGKSYLSDSSLSEEAQNFIKIKSQN